MQAHDIMTKNVVTATPDTSVDQVAALMIEHDISAVPIVDENGAIAGLISEGDLMRRVEGAAQQPKSWWLSFFAGSEKTATDFIVQRGRHARDIMTRDVETVAPDQPVGEIARLLERKRIKRVPVVENGVLVGLVSRANLL
ncbi:MAG: CBS domain-containing protein, partial [Halocynthiibacter sp.]